MRGTGRINVQRGHRVAKYVKLAVDVFNVLNAADSDIDHYYTWRLPGESLTGIKRHPHASDRPLTVHANLIGGF